MTKRSPKLDGGVMSLATGFLFFGGVLGLICGLSEVAGISQSLLTSMFTFVGGVLLSYVGFRRQASREQTAEAAPNTPAPTTPAPLDVDRNAVGLGLTFFSIGIIAGLFAGATLRGRAEATRIPPNGGGPVVSQGPSGTTVRRGPLLLLHDQLAGPCGTATSRLSSGYYNSKSTDAVLDLKSLSDA